MKKAIIKIKIYPTSGADIKWSSEMFDNEKEVLEALIEYFKKVLEDELQT